MNNFETIQVSDVDSIRKMHKDERVNYDVMLQAQQANTRIQVRTHELLDSDSSDEESVADLKVNMHNLRSKIKGLLEFSDSESEDEDALESPIVMTEALTDDAKGEIVNPDTSEEQSIEQKGTAKMFEGMLHFSDSEDEDEDEAQFQLETHGFASSIEEGAAATGNEGVVGEQEGNLSGLTDSNPERRRLLDEFYSESGLMHFSDSEDEAEEKVKVKAKKEETKAMTRNEHRKACIAPPPASKAPCPKGRRAHSLSPKPTDLETSQITSAPQTPKVAIVKPAATQVVKPTQGRKFTVSVATDTLLDSSDPQQQARSVTVHHRVPSPKQATTKTFASVESTPKSPALAMPQQANPKAQTPAKEEQQPKKVPNQNEGKGNLKSKSVTMDQKIVKVNKQIVCKAKQAEKTDSPSMKKPFDEVAKPIKTAKRIVETPDGKS